MVYTSIDIRKIKFVAYIYIPFSQNPNENWISVGQGPTALAIGAGGG